VCAVCAVYIHGVDVCVCVWVLSTVVKALACQLPS